MKWAILGLAVLLTAAAPVEDPLIALERQSWVAWQAQDADWWANYLSDDHVEMGYGGRATKADVVGAIRAHICTVASYKLSDLQVRYFSRDIALVTYRAEQDTTCGGIRVPSPVWASSLFARRKGRWVNTYYAHIPIKG